MFQSLKGIHISCNSLTIESLLYLVFQVRFREPSIKIAFQAFVCQDATFANGVKSNYGKHSRVFANLIANITSLKPCSVRDSAEKLASLGKTANGSRKIVITGCVGGSKVSGLTNDR